MTFKIGIVLFIEVYGFKKELNLLVQHQSFQLHDQSLAYH